MEAKLAIHDLTKTYNGRSVLNRLSFTVNGGEFLSVLGPSGCGKTTLRRILIGIEYADSGGSRRTAGISGVFRRRIGAWASCSRTTPSSPT